MKTPAKKSGGGKGKSKSNIQLKNSTRHPPLQAPSAWKLIGYEDSLITHLLARLRNRNQKSVVI